MTLRFADGVGQEIESFDSFYRRDIRSLTALAYTLSGSASTAEDLAQEALASAARQWDRIGALDDPSAWVRRVVANRSTSAIRRRITEMRWRTRFVRSDEASAIAPMPSDSAHVWSLVRGLPRRQAQVIALKALEGLSLQEIAEVLEISKESVNTHLRRARQTLTTQLNLGADDADTR